MPPISNPLHRRLLLVAKLAILVALAWGVHRTFWDGIRQLRERPLSLSFPWLVISGALYLVGMVPACLYWRRVLRVIGHPTPLGRTIRAYFIGHLGKYVPGKALVVVLRTGMVSDRGVDLTTIAATVFVETLTTMASGSFIAAALIAILFHEHWLYVAGAIACMVAAGLPTLPPVFARLTGFAQRAGLKAMSGVTAHSAKPTAGAGRSNSASRGYSAALTGDPTAALERQYLAADDHTHPAPRGFENLDYGTLLLGWIGTGIGWPIMGLSLWATLKATGATTLGPIEALPQMTMVTCVAVVAGFMSMIPGGIGVREAVLAKLIEPLLGASAAISTLILRLVWLAAELIASLALYPFWRKRH